MYFCVEINTFTVRFKQGSILNCNMKHTIINFFLITILSGLLSCSNSKKLARKAMTSYDRGEYYAAIEYFERLYDDEKNKQKKGKWAYYAGDCYRRINEPKDSKKNFKRALGKDYEVAKSTLLYADQLREIGEYEDAAIEYENYKKLVPEDERGDIGLRSCKLAVEWTDAPTRYEVELLKDVSSRDNDFCPSYASEDFTRIYFTSSRPKEDDKEKDNKKEPKPSAVSGMPYTNVFEIRVDRQGKWTDALQLEDTIINTEFDDGATAFNAAKTELYFTQCMMETGKQLGCRIMHASKKGTEWGGAQVLPIVPDSISVGHPSISADGLELYFAARMEGGEGGSDIWKCTRSSEGGEWGKPENLGPQINSSGDEMYPYIRKDGNLYFSSDYWEGMGGLDIFKAIKDEETGNWIRSNMQYPINSSQDDFGIVFQGKRERGLFSSSRKGRGGDDIYSFVLPELEFYVEGTIYDRSSGKPIVEADVKLIGSDGSIKDLTTMSDGTYRFPLQQYTDYLVVGSGGGYLLSKTRVSTNNVIDDTTFVKDIELITLSKPVEIPNIFYDFGKWTLNESSQQALEELGQLLEDNPNVTIEMGAHTDMVGDSASNMRLSMKRAESVVTYLKEHGYDPDRLVAKGYGESKPVVVNERLAAADTLFKEGQVLDEEFVLSLDNKDLQEKVNQINRRTELRILTTNYIPKPEYFLRYKKNKMKLEEE